MNTRSFISRPMRPQRGVSLLTVLVLLVLCLTAVTSVFRVVNLNEAMLSNNSDYSRAQAAAEALIRDAEIDIRGRIPPYTTVQADHTIGTPCSPDPPGHPMNVLAGFEGCRYRAAGNTPWYPTASTAEYEDVALIISGLSTAHPAIQCAQGICTPANTTDLAHIEDNLTAMIPFGATYGQFTRGAVGPRPALTAAGVSGNPVLDTTTPRAWYWVEVFRATEVPSSGAMPAALTAVQPDQEHPFIYRITAVAQGLKPGTRVVIKSLFVPYPKNELANQ